MADVQGISPSQQSGMKPIQFLHKPDALEHGFVPVKNVFDAEPDEVIIFIIDGALPSTTIGNLSIVANVEWKP